MSRSFRPPRIRLILAAALSGAVSCAPQTGEEAAAPADSAPESEVSAAEAAATVEATPGITDERVLFGQSAAFTGPAQELGLGMQLGIQAAFQEANGRGGVHGRMLELVSLDDAYEPEAAVVNTQQLIEQEQVFALIGAVGTPTSRSATPVAAEADVPYIAPFTGAAFLRDPAWDNIINLRASYQQETEEMVARLTGDLGIDRIAVMYQDDSFGRDGYQGVRLALARRGMEPVAIGLYPRNTAAVKTALLDLHQGDPQAVIMIGAYQPVSMLINWAQHTGMDAVFLTVSFVGSNALAQALGDSGRGRGGDPGGAVPDQRFAAGGGVLPERAVYLRPRRRSRIRLPGRLPGRAPRHRRASAVRRRTQP